MQARHTLEALPTPAWRICMGPLCPYDPSAETPCTHMPRAAMHCGLMCAHTHRLCDVHHAGPVTLLDVKAMLISL